MVTLIRGRPIQSFQIRTVKYSDPNCVTILKFLCVDKSVCKSYCVYQ